jgi:hypothetical protein
VPIAMRIEEIRRGLTARLRARRPEIEQAALTRVHAIADPKETADPEYTQGLRTAIAAAIAYGIDALERSEDRAPPIPTALLSQARLAARNRIPLETVLRRYFAGYTLLGDFVLEEAERAGIGSGTPLKHLLRTQAALFDRMIAAVTGEYGREEHRPGSSKERRMELVKRLLDGELADASGLGYDLEQWHLGLIATEPGAGAALRAIADALGCCLLAIPAAEQSVWAWFGSRRKPDPDSLTSLENAWSPETSLVIGEPAQGLSGWRLTHRQAAAALPIALRRRPAVVRYSEASLLASVIRDDLLATSLRERYLRPLELESSGGAILRETLNAYFAADRNVSSAAAALGASRNTIAGRLSAVERRLEQPLASCATEVELALRLAELDSLAVEPVPEQISA